MSPYLIRLNEYRRCVDIRTREDEFTSFSFTEAQKLLEDLPVLLDRLKGLLAKDAAEMIAKGQAQLESLK